MSPIPDELMMHAERLYDEGGYKSVPMIIAEAILAERDRCAGIAEEQRVKWASADWTNPQYIKGNEHMAFAIRNMIRGKA